MEVAGDHSIVPRRNWHPPRPLLTVLEGVVLRQLRAELLPDPAQYGGSPGCGAEHMLVEIWEKVLSSMEGGKSAAVLLGVDYEKAFNRMEHSVCIAKLRALGASVGSVALVRAFLEQRGMTITLDGHRAPAVPLLRGSPQGSILGCLLYFITTQLLTSNLRGGDLNAGGGGSPQAFLYVDDTTLLDVVGMDKAVRHCTVGKTVEAFPELEVGRDFEVLTTRADDIGMKINGKKTQLLVISPPNGCTTGATITAADGSVINSVERLRLVGFTFGTEPNAAEHVEALRMRYMSKKRMLYHL